MENTISKLKVEDFIWIIYIFIAIFALISNYYERKYYYFKSVQDRKKYRYINITIFEVAIIIYLYFLYQNIQDINNNQYAFLSVFSSVLFVVAGAITLYVEYQHANDEDLGII